MGGCVCASETSSDRTRAVALMLGLAFADAGLLSGEYPMGYIRALFSRRGENNPHVDDQASTAGRAFPQR